MKSIIFLTIVFIALGIFMVSGAIPCTFENFQNVFFAYLIFVVVLVLLRYFYNHRNRAATAKFWDWLRDDYRNRKDS